MEIRRVLGIFLVRVELNGSVVEMGLEELVTVAW
jgi:hypothetical protein